jgi:hypothetical protein
MRKTANEAKRLCSTAKPPINLYEVSERHDYYNRSVTGIGHARIAVFRNDRQRGWPGGFEKGNRLCGAEGAGGALRRVGGGARNGWELPRIVRPEPTIFACGNPDVARCPTPANATMAKPPAIVERGPAPGVGRSPVPTAIGVNPAAAIIVRTPGRIHHHHSRLPAGPVSIHVHPGPVRAERISEGGGRNRFPGACG